MDNNIEKLEAIIYKRLNELNSNSFPLVYQMINTKTGKQKIFERIKSMIMFEGYENIESCINSIENSSN